MVNNDVLLGYIKDITVAKLSGSDLAASENADEIARFMQKGICLLFLFVFIFPQGFLNLTDTAHVAHESPPHTKAWRCSALRLPAPYLNSKE